MSSFEWMELQTLTADIAASRSRLTAARSAKDNRLTRILEQEISSAERRRDQLLANITNQVADAGEPAAEPEATGVAAAPGFVDAAPAAEQTDEPDSPPSASYEPASHSAGSPARNPEGDTAVWDQLTPGDIENAKSELAGRRAEMLARHAEELKALDADQNQLDTLAEAIELFARKFKVAAQGETPNAAVVTLEEERELRLQGRA